MADLTLKGVKKIYDGGVTAVEDFNIDIKDKEFIVLVGPSGCGKSTTMRMIAGLEEITEGEISIGGTVVNNIAPKDRDIAMVFQNYALYPHMTVGENMAFSLKLRKTPKNVIAEKVNEAARILGIEDLLDRTPKALSGGQRQRVAIGRAIVRNPKVLLMDEPLSNLDAKLRNLMRAEIIKLRSKIDTTFIYVTHDQTEAMTLGDRIVVMSMGHVQQIGTPQEVFENPKNLFVAGFIGSPQMNFVDAKLMKENGKYAINICDKTKVVLPEDKQAILASKKVQEGDVTFGIRPDHLSISTQPRESDIEATIDVTELMGTTVHVHANAFGVDMIIILQTAAMDKQTRAMIKAGETVRLAVNEDMVYAFSKEDESNLFFV